MARGEVSAARTMISAFPRLSILVASFEKVSCTWISPSGPRGRGWGWVGYSFFLLFPLENGDGRLRASTHLHWHLCVAVGNAELVGPGRVSFERALRQPRAMLEIVRRVARKGSNAQEMYIYRLMARRPFWR